MKLSMFAGMVTAALLASSAANATPFTYQFSMPAWDFSTGPDFGTNALLSLTVDNGGLSYKNQSYSFLNITSATVTAQGGTFDYSWSSSELAGKQNPGVVFLSTDALGIATLDLSSSATQQALVVFNDGGLDLEFSILGMNGGNYPFTVANTSFGDGAVILGPTTCNFYCGFEVIDPTPPTDVPEPSSIAVLLAGLGLIGGAMRFGGKEMASVKG